MTNVTWQSFLPFHVAQDLLANPGSSPLGREQRFSALVLFADISGFTAISEALGATGKSGTEELTRILNDYFEPMVALVHTFGGIIGKFGGDAMTVLFPFEAGSRALVASRAVQCALEMQARMPAYAAIKTQAGVFGLAMKAGLAAGPVFCTTVGDPAVRLEYVIAGEALDVCAEAEHRAARGQVVAQQAVLDSISGAVWTPLGDQFGLVLSAGEAVPAAPLPLLPGLPAEAAQFSAAYIHPSIARRLEHNQLSFINEHRKVTCLFVAFTGFDYDRDPDAGSRLQGYLLQVVQIVQRYDGYLNKVDMGDKGSKCIILFGAPIAHENDVERALRCALDIQAIPGEPARIGVNTGNVYCGQVGAATRREYTVMGDAVNLAARLMQAARPAQVLVGDATWRLVHSASASTRDIFTWETDQLIQVKGKAEAVRVRALSGVRPRSRLGLQEPQYNLRMVGRQEELDFVHCQLERVFQGQGHIIGLTAEAGMGKSRLAAEIIYLATGFGLDVYAGECLSHGTTTSYLAWRPLLRSFFDLEGVAGPQLDEHLKQRLSEVDPVLAGRAPLLGLALNLPLPENDLTRSLDARLRKESLEALLIACFRHYARHKPLLLVIEDSHWIDPLSNDLLEAVGRNIADVPVLLLVIYRPPETEAIQPRVSRFAHFTEIRLKEYTRLEAEELISLKLLQLFGDQQVAPPLLLERIFERSQGNPFYIDEMVNLLHDRGINLRDVQAWQDFDLPDSLHSLIISRIDQLAESAKTTIKVASVIGRSFRANWLWGICPELGTPEWVIEQLNQLSRLDITPLDKPEPELEYLFKHIVTREVAYSSLALATRQMLHEQTGAFIECTYLNKLDRFVDWLAFHYGLSTNLVKQREYFRKAGEAAQAAYANQAAINYFERLLAVLPAEAAQEKVPVLLRLGQVQQLIGEWNRAQEIFQQALELSETELGRLQGSSPAGAAPFQLSLARCRFALGALERQRGAYDEALDWLDQARAGFEAAQDWSGLCETMREIGVTAWSQGEYQPALEQFTLSLNIAQRIEDHRSMYRAIGNIGIVRHLQGDYDGALESYHQGYQIASQIGDRLGMSTLEGNIGNILQEQGEYGQALQQYSQCFQSAVEIGDRLGVGIAIGNMGTIYSDYGDPTSALACFGFALKVTLELGDQLGVSTALWNMAKEYVSMGRGETAGTLLEQAVAIGRALENPYELSEYLYTLADLLFRQEKFARAQAVNREALSMALQVERDDIYFVSDLLEQRLRFVQGQADAQQVLARLEEMLAHTEEAEQQAEIYYQTCQLGLEAENACQRAVELYGDLYHEVPNMLYRQRYEALAGEPLGVTGAPALPPLPEIVTKTLLDLASLMDQVQALVVEQGAD